MKRQIVVIHGGGAFNSYKEYLTDLKSFKFDFNRIRSKGWKIDFAKKLGKNYDVIQPRMPNPNNAKYLEWKIFFKKLIPFLDKEIILIGHSLSAIFLVKYLSEENFRKKVKAVFLIAAPYNTKDHHPLADFNLKKTLTKLIKQAGTVYLYQSKDDKVVPFSNFMRYKKELPDAKLRVFSSKGHFNQTEFPELIKDIRTLR